MSEPQSVEQETVRVRPRFRTTEPIPDPVFVHELAALVRSGKKPIYTACEKGWIAHYRIGRNIRIPREEALRVRREGIRPREEVRS